MRRWCFFSSRRRHTRYWRDWSSDVCSSDLFASNHPGGVPFATAEMAYGTQVLWPDHCVQGSRGADFHAGLADGVEQADMIRSEERRVGKECRSRWSPYH